MKLGIFLSLMLTLSFIIIPISADQEEIPNWIRQNSLWWGEGKISDSEFISAMEYLIENKIIVIPNNSSSNISDEYFEEYKLWANNEIKKFVDYSNKLKQKIYDLEKQLDNSEDTLDTYKTAVDEYDKYLDSWFDEQESKPETKIYEQTIHWRVTDSKGNTYNWSMPVQSYEAYVIADRFSDLLYFQDKRGESFTVWDHTKYVKTSFSNIIDQVYDNSNNDNDFVYEIWFITSQLTTYSYDIGDYPRYALETLSRGGGDCEDTTILMLDMLKSSKHTKDWEFQMLYFDTDELKNPRSINHVAPVIRINDENWMVIESTAKTLEGMNSWNGKSIVGWWQDV